MTDLGEALPDDPKVLQEIVRTMRSALADKERRIEQLLHQLREHLRQRFGRRSEKLSDGQLALFLDELAKAGDVEVDAAAPAPGPPPRRARPHGRRPLPRDLPRQRIEHPVPEEERTCQGCHEPMSRIGEEVSEQLDYRPATMVVLEHVRPKYACPRCQEGVVTAEKPPQPIEKGLPGAGLLSHVVVSKYADHLPLYRQAGILRRHGVEIPSSTLGDWVRETAEVLSPLCHRMKALVLESEMIRTDDTPVPVLDPERTSVREGRLWVYLGDATHPFTVYDFSPDHQQRWPREFLDGYRGYLQADAYRGYDQLFEDGRVIEVACWAHGRRRFYEAQATDTLRSHVALAFIHLLYEVEDAARPLGHEERQRLREERSRPLLVKFEAWLGQQAPAVLPKSPIGEAITYARNQWTALTRYIEDGRLEIDNNAAERALRAVVLGRKNYLFAGSDGGGRSAAVHYSLIQTAKAHGLDPFEYLRDVFAKLPTWPAKRVDELLPPAWKAARAPPHATS